MKRFKVKITAVLELETDDSFYEYEGTSSVEQVKADELENAPVAIAEALNGSDEIKYSVEVEELPNSPL